MKSGSWTETVYRVAIAADRLMTMDELRDAVGKVRTLEKQRLKDSGHIVSYKWRIGTPAARQRFLEEVAANRARDLPAVRYRSRWGGAICALLRHSARDLTAHEISLELRKDQEFAYKLSRILRFKAASVLCTDPFVATDTDLVPLDHVLERADVLVIAAPHKAYKTLTPHQPVVDVWNVLGEGVRV